MWKRPDSKVKKQTQATLEQKEEIAVIAKPNTEPLVREKSSFGKSLIFKGDITGNEDMYIHGRIEGTICLKNNALTIGRQGHVSANIFAKCIYIEGELNGDAYASDQIIVKKSGNIRGNVIAPRVTVEDGAVVKGSIDMDPHTIDKYFPQDKLDNNENVIVAKAIHTEVTETSAKPVKNEFTKKPTETVKAT